MTAGAAGVAGLLSHWSVVHLIFLFSIARNLDVPSFRVMTNTIGSDFNYYSAHRNVSIPVLFAPPRAGKKDERSYMN